MSLPIIALLASVLLTATNPGHSAETAVTRSTVAKTAATEATVLDPEFSARDVRAEFEELYTRLRASHYDLYARRAKPEYDAFYASMRKGFDRPMRLSELQLAFQRFVAHGRIAHARIDEAGAAYERFRVAGGKAIALHIRVVDGHVHVVRNLSGNGRIAAGDELIALDGEPMKKILSQLGEHVSADHEYMLNTLLEQRFPGLLWQVWGERERFVATVRKPDGSKRATPVLARSRSQADVFLKQQAQTLELDWNKREARMLADDVAYLRPGPFYNNDEGATDPWDNSSFVQFINNAFIQFDQAGAKKLLIDLRDNPGGDNSFSDVMLGWFANRPFRFTSDFRIKVSSAATQSNAKRLAHSAVGSMSHQLAAGYAQHKNGEKFSFDLALAQPRQGKRFAGKVFMLINRHSYSNTANVAALAQDYGFAHILGEETSDLVTTYGAMEQFQLTRTGITVGFPKAHIIRVNGDLQARGVVPDIAIATPLVQAQDDPVLQRALKLVSQ